MQKHTNNADIHVRTSRHQRWAEPVSRWQAASEESTQYWRLAKSANANAEDANIILKNHSRC